MRIVHYLSQFQLAHGGVVRAVLDVAGLLAHRGHDVQVLTWDATDIPDEWKTGEDGVPDVLEIPPPTRPGGLLGGLSLGEAEGAVREADVLHLHTPWDLVNRQLAKAARRTHTPYVLTVHGMLDDWSMAQRGWKKRLYLAFGGRRLLERAALVHCTAQGELDQAGRWFPRGRGFVIPCVCDLGPFRELPGPELARRSIPAIDVDEPVILFLSRIHYKKQPEALIDAAALLRDRGVACRIAFAGAGDDRYVEELRQRVRRRDVEDRVFFLGLVVGEEKVSLYERAEVFALPTQQENFGLVYPEALACRTPVVTTRGTDIWRELEESGGAVIAEGNASAFADAVAELLADSERRRHMGERGREWVFRELDGEQIVRRYEEMYQQALSR